MVGPGYWCHHNIQSGLGVGVTIIYGWARVTVSPLCTVWPGYRCDNNIQSGLGVGVTIIYGQARVPVSP